MAQRSQAIISVIVPMLDEARLLPSTLTSVRAVDGVQLIVVDGGSTDDSAVIAQRHGATVLRAERGKARQMNVGAAAADGELLLFLHADTRLPSGYDDHVREMLATPGAVAGAFRLRIDAPGRSLRLVERVANWRARSLRFPYGDQGLCLEARRFADLDGYDDLPIMEDYALVRRLRRQGRIVIADACVETSARRWQALGVWRATALNQLAVLAYAAGVDPRRIARWYFRADHRGRFAGSPGRVATDGRGRQQP